MKVDNFLYRHEEYTETSMWSFAKGLCIWSCFFLVYKGSKVLVLQVRCDGLVAARLERLRVLDVCPERV